MHKDDFSRTHLYDHDVTIDCSIRVYNSLCFTEFLFVTNYNWLAYLVIPSNIDFKRG